MRLFTTTVTGAILTCAPCAASPLCRHSDLPAARRDAASPANAVVDIVAPPREDVTTKGIPPDMRDG